MVAALTEEFPRGFTADRSGAIRSKNGRRLVLLDADMWQNSKKEFFSAFDLGADALLFHIGRVYGRTIGQDWKGVTREELFPALEELVVSLGWGRARIRPSREGSRGRIIMENCVFCENFHNRERPACQELAGVISGAAAEITGKEHSVNEVSCIGMGDEACEFDIVERKAATKT